jgi:hypothetical protein
MSVKLIYQKNLLPLLNDRTLESTVGNWATVGNHAVSRVTTAKRSGLASLKVIASGAGDNSANHAKLPTANFSSFILSSGQTASVTIYIQGTIGNTYTLYVGAGAGHSATLVATGEGAWDAFNLPEWTPTVADSDLRIYAPGAETFYLDDLSVNYMLSLATISVRGIDDFDDVQYINPVQNQSDNGTLYDLKDGFRRVITIDFGVVLTKSDRIFINDFLYNSTYRAITHGSETIQVVPADGAGHSNVWLNNTHLGRSYTLRLLEKTALTASPSSWTS